MGAQSDSSAYPEQSFGEVEGEEDDSIALYLQGEDENSQRIYQPLQLDHNENNNNLDEEAKEDNDILVDKDQEQIPEIAAEVVKHEVIQEKQDQLQINEGVNMAKQESTDFNDRSNCKLVDHRVTSFNNLYEGRYRDEELEEEIKVEPSIKVQAYKDYHKLVEEEVFLNNGSEVAATAMISAISCSAYGPGVQNEVLSHQEEIVTESQRYLDGGLHYEEQQLLKAQDLNHSKKKMSQYIVINDSFQNHHGQDNLKDELRMSSNFHYKAVSQTGKHLVLDAPHPFQSDDYISHVDIIDQGSQPLTYCNQSQIMQSQQDGMARKEHNTQSNIYDNTQEGDRISLKSYEPPQTNMAINEDLRIVQESQEGDMASQQITEPFLQ